jgi:hypothetical protein
MLAASSNFTGFANLTGTRARAKILQCDLISGADAGADLVANVSQWNLLPVDENVKFQSRRACLRCPFGGSQIEAANFLRPPANRVHGFQENLSSRWPHVLLAPIQRFRLESRRSRQFNLTPWRGLQPRDP